MTADEIIAFKKKQNAKTGIPNINDKDITVSEASVMGFPVLIHKRALGSHRCARKKCSLKKGLVHAAVWHFGYADKAARTRL